MPKYNIKHITRYNYPQPVIDSANQVMLFPIQDKWQEVSRHELSITHQPQVETFVDYFGNRIGVFSVVKAHDELTILSEIDVITHPVILPQETLSPEAQWNELNNVSAEYPYMDFVLQESIDSQEEIISMAAGIRRNNDTPLALVQQLSTYVYENFEYKKGITNVETKVDEIWKLRAGVCQDFAHVLLVMLRSMGIPARYVSGYICPKDQELRGEGATHAWVDAYIPLYGWLGLDPTNNCIVSDRHVRLAVGRHFSDCTPVKGTYKGSSEHSLEVSVSINNAGEKPLIVAETPVFSYKVENPAQVNNSYRRHLEMQQQQQ
ncbi:MAG TPA: transglutaminase family protein [Flavipsychrobacter sp.]|nr:transglutaminase family protein [Flavipsychrobacter sp.]